MSSPLPTSTGSGAGQDVVMDTDSESELAVEPSRTAPITEDDGSLAMLLQDTASGLSEVRALKETDLIILLTPVVMPTDRESSEVSDPFEPLGRALAKSHARIRHVPYLPRDGLTSTHLTFIQRGHAIILCLVVPSPQQIPLELIDTVFAAREHKPCVLIICSSSTSTAPLNQPIPFPTAILTKGHSARALEAAAPLIFTSPLQNPPSPSSLSLTSSHPLPTWPITPFSPVLDIPPLHTLWTESLPALFTLPPQTLSPLLNRPGYASHYTILSDPPSTILGFAATYLTYADRAGEDLLASLAILIVHPSSRGRGIGRALHDHALRELGRTRGVTRFQLGSVFPRLLAGPPASGELEWFARRGWGVRDAEVVRDLLLDFRDWGFAGAEEGHLALSGEGLQISGIRFRSARVEDMPRILGFVDESARRMGKMGWFDQYAALMKTNGGGVSDVIVGVDGGDGEDDIVAAALTYTPSCGNQVAANMPWVESIGDDVGGVTCICIAAPLPPSAILPPIINASINHLRTKGMSRVFLDTINPSTLADLQALGFREWAAYRSVWRDT